jgi:predicted nucleotidyltransferase component of viral defense system
MNLHTNKELLEDAILATAEFLDMREIYVEKDYWVTVALYEIFHSDIADQSVFKGGTALSKCYKLIERFSEDIDLVVLRNEGENDNRLKKKIRAISKVVDKVIPEIDVEGITNKFGNIRKTVHQYTKLFEGDFGQAREQIVVEATYLGHFEPFSEMQVNAYIYEMMKFKGQDELIEQYNMAPFTVQVLSKLRTFCEKIMSLVRFSKTEEPIVDLRNKIRHIYDMHLMLKDREIQQFLESTEFDDMLIKVGKDDMIGYKNNNDWISEHPSTAILFDNPQETWKQLSSAYKGNFKDLVIGKLPSEGELIETLIQVALHLKEIDWQINKVD